MQVPFEGRNLNNNQVIFNSFMSKVRIAVEWMFKVVKLCFLVVSNKWKLKLHKVPVGLFYIGATLPRNLPNGFHLNQISTYFKASPPTFYPYITERRGDSSSKVNKLPLSLKKKLCMGLKQHERHFTSPLSSHPTST